MPGYGNPTDGFVGLGEAFFGVRSGTNLAVTRTGSSQASSAQGVLVIEDVITAPTSLGDTHLGFMYVQSGHLMFMGGQGTVTTVASA